MTPMIEDDRTAILVGVMFIGSFILMPLAIHLVDKIIEKIFKP